MNDSELSLLASCINADSFTEEQMEFLQKWWMVTTLSDVEAMNQAMRVNFKIAPRQTVDGQVVIPVTLLTDLELYAPIIDDLQQLEKVELTSQQFSDYQAPVDAVDETLPELTDELRAELIAAGATFD